jgi:hypothetical protein
MVEQQKTAKTSSRYAFAGFIDFQSRLPKTVAADEEAISGTLDGARLVDQNTWKDAPHRTLANLPREPKALEMFVKRHGILHGSAIADDSFSESIKNFVAAQELLRKAWEGEVIHSLSRIKDEMKSGFAIETVRPRKNSVVITTHDLWKFICFLFLRDHKGGKLGKCENPDCPAPYFLKKRKTQRFCDSELCTAFAQSQYALKWWREKGTFERERRRKGAVRKER